jgi:hypothetical protein
MLTILFCHRRTSLNTQIVYRDILIDVLKNCSKPSYQDNQVIIFELTDWTSGTDIWSKGVFPVQELEPIDCGFFQRFFL